MACFIVPLTQAVVTTLLRKRLSKDKSNPIPEQSSPTRSPWLSQLPKLELMLWGGSLMLVVDHIINGELTWQYPFFTAMEQAFGDGQNADGIMTMLHEMLTVGVPMSALVTLCYIGIVIRQIATQR